MRIAMAGGPPEPHRHSSWRDQHAICGGERLGRRAT
jgi:hypothetical protein